MSIYQLPHSSRSSCVYACARVCSSSTVQRPATTASDRFYFLMYVIISFTELFILILWLLLFSLTWLTQLLRLLLLLLSGHGTVLASRLAQIARLLTQWILRCWCWNFDNNVGWFTHHFGFEAFFWIGGVCDGTNETIRIDDRVAAFDLVAITNFFAILIVGVFVVFHIEAELVRWVGVLQSRMECILLVSVCFVFRQLDHRMRVMSSTCVAKPRQSAPHSIWIHLNLNDRLCEIGRHQITKLFSSDFIKSSKSKTKYPYHAWIPVLSAVILCM